MPTYQPHPDHPTPRDGAIDFWAEHEHALVHYRAAAAEGGVTVRDMHDGDLVDGWETSADLEEEFGPIVYPTLADYRASRGWAFASVLAALGVEPELGEDLLGEIEGDSEWRASQHIEPYDFADLPPGAIWLCDAAGQAIGWVDENSGSSTELLGLTDAAERQAAIHAAAWTAFMGARVPRGFDIVETPTGWRWTPTDAPELPDQLEWLPRPEALQLAWTTYLERAAEILADLMTLAGVWAEHDLEALRPSAAIVGARMRWIKSWTLLERGQVARWAAATHGAAGDTGADVPDRPACLDRGASGC